MIRNKVRDYLRTGTKQVWLIYPENREIIVHLPDGTSMTYSVGQSVPGFALDVARVFA